MHLFLELVRGVTTHLWIPASSTYTSEEVLLDSKSPKLFEISGRELFTSSHAKEQLLAFLQFLKLCLENCGNIYP